jgi:hypothetical protein
MNPTNQIIFYYNFKGAFVKDNLLCNFGEFFTKNPPIPLKSKGKALYIRHFATMLQNDEKFLRVQGKLFTKSSLRIYAFITFYLL